MSNSIREYNKILGAVEELALLEEDVCELWIGEGSPGAGGAVHDDDGVGDETGAGVALGCSDGGVMDVESGNAGAVFEAEVVDEDIAFYGCGVG